MTKQAGLCVILDAWDPSEKAWPIRIPVPPRSFSLSSLKAGPTDIPEEQWELDRSGKTTFVRWLGSTVPPERPTAVVSFSSVTPREQVWVTVSRINKLTGIMALLGALGTASFSYFGNNSRNEATQLNHEIQQWQEALKPLHCTEQIDPERAISECLSQYAKDKTELAKDRISLDACTH